MTDRNYSFALSPKKMVLYYWLLMFLIQSLCWPVPETWVRVRPSSWWPGVEKLSNNNPEFHSEAHSFWSQTMNFWCCHFPCPKRNHNMQPVYLLKSLDVKHRKGGWRVGCVTQHHYWMRQEWECSDVIAVLALFFPSQVYIQFLMKPFVKRHTNYI